MRWLLCMVVGCATVDPVDDLVSAETEDSVVEDTVVPDEPGDTPDTDPWPETGRLPGPTVSLVHDGALLADGDAVRIVTAPAGLSETETLRFVLTNRSGTELSFGPAEDWLVGEGFTWAEAPPGSLAPDESAAFTLEAAVAAETEAIVREATLSPPGTGLSVMLSADVPRPLRLLVVGSGGYTAVSDDYGASFVDQHVPTELVTARHTVAWGEGTFFRGYASGGDWGDPGRYDASVDGTAWTPATVNDGFWPSDCAYGLGRFVCAWSSGIAWSDAGAGVVHQSNGWGQMFNAVVFDGTRFVMVGRDTHVGVSLDGAGFAHDFHIDDDLVDDLAALAYGEGVYVAVGGDNRQLVATSTDALDWTITELHAQQYSRLHGVAHNGAFFLATGSSGPNLWRSDDGVAWAEVGADTTGLELLGAVQGRFLATRTPWQQQQTLHTSADGVTWTQVHAVPGTEIRVQDLAVERWEP